jgi:acetylornithine deacetylase/succinyl-diaminopimelate desuccinylase-like protein
LELPTTPRTTLHCGTISGGTSVNSIPESATADLDLRSVSAEQLDLTEAQLLATIRTTVDAANSRNLLALELARIGNRPAAALPADSALLASLRAVDRHLHIATESRIGSTDANWPLSLGVPALAIGAGGTAGGIHTLREWYDPTGRELALRRVLMHLLDACSLAAGCA